MEFEESTFLAQEPAASSTVMPSQDGGEGLVSNENNIKE